MAKDEKPLWEKKWQESRHPTRRQLDAKAKAELDRRLGNNSDKGKKK